MKTERALLNPMARKAKLRKKGDEKKRPRGTVHLGWRGGLYTLRPKTPKNRRRKLNTEWTKSKKKGRHNTQAQPEKRTKREKVSRKVNQQSTSRGRPTMYNT